MSWALVVVSISASARSSRGAGPVDFDRDIRPILSENCFACHGPDTAKRKAELRLDTKDGAFADLGGSRHRRRQARRERDLSPGSTSDDPEEQMPPPDSDRSRSRPAQVAT